MADVCMKIDLPSNFGVNGAKCTHLILLTTTTTTTTPMPTQMQVTMPESDPMSHQLAQAIEIKHVSAKREK